MRLDLVRDAAVATRLPEVIAERCVHSLIEQGTCRRCVYACPTGAWVIDDERLGIAPARCDGCGLCAPACPQAAIVARSGEPLLVDVFGSAAPGAIPYRGQGAALTPPPRTSEPGSAALGAIAAMLACDRAFAGGSATRGAISSAIVPCVHALGARDLARLAAAGCRQLIVATGDCNACTRGTVVRLEHRLADLARLLDSRGLPLLRVEWLAAERWRDARDAAVPDPGPVMARRAFLRRGLGAAIDQTATAFGLADAERAAIETVARLLPDTGRAAALAPVGPRIDAATCTGCDACVQLCPQQVIRLERLDPADSVWRGQPVGEGASRVAAERGAVAEREADTGAPVPRAEGGAGREDESAAGGLTFRLTPSDCTGCGICVDVCADRAVRLEAWVPASPLTLPLAEATCARCRVRFHRPVLDTGEGPAHCPICARRSGTDRLFRVQDSP